MKEDEENHTLLQEFGRDGLFDRRVVAESRLQQLFRQLLQLLGFAEPLKWPGEERTLITFEHAIQASATHTTAQHSADVVTSYDAHHDAHHMTHI